jgi:putative phosphoribosyl transferase
MYFPDRATAGKLLAERLSSYQNQPTIVIALSESSAVVAAQVALQLHASMALYMIKDIVLPNEIEALAALSSTGVFQYNSLFSAGQVEELASEYRGFIEEQRIQKNHEMNVLLGEAGTIRKDLLRHHVVILVADGLASGFALNMAGEFMRTVAIKKFVVATPVASVEATDRMHSIADELHCLYVPDNFMGVDHYYETTGKTTVEDALKIIKNISLSWKLDRPEVKLDTPEEEGPSKTGHDRREFLS